jgi:hypothetical protein
MARASELHCPICKIDWPSQISCCPCGFAPAAIDDFVVRLKLQRRRSITLQVVGTLLIAVTVPVVFALPMALGLLQMGVFTVAGTIALARGSLGVAQATRRLRAVAELRQLPTARIVER